MRLPEIRFARYWCGWWHCYSGWRVIDGSGRWAFSFGLGHFWAPRYCITWVGPWSYWHMHHADEPDFDTGWSPTFERFDREEEEEDE